MAFIVEGYCSKCNVFHQAGNWCTKKYPRPHWLRECQGCGAQKEESLDSCQPRQDPSCPTLRGAVRWLCARCYPSWKDWSEVIA